MASDLLALPKISQAVEELIQKKARSQGISAEWVLDTIRKVVEGAQEEKDRTNALRGLELLGKYLRLWDKQEQNNGVTVVITSALPCAPGMQQVVDVSAEPIALPVSPELPN